MVDFNSVFVKQQTIRTGYELRSKVDVLGLVHCPANETELRIDS